MVISACALNEDIPKEQITTEDDVTDFLDKTTKRLGKDENSGSTDISTDSPDVRDSVDDSYQDDQAADETIDSKDDSHHNDKSAVGIEESAGLFEAENPAPPSPAELDEISAIEAIVVDDKEADLWASADGTEADYPHHSDKDSLPAFYMSDNVYNMDYVTPVRNQGYTALCWVYSALGAIESDLLKNHKGFDVSTLNLSEKHSAYFNMHRATGSLNRSIDDDYREFIFNSDNMWLDKYDTCYISVGGVTNYCLSLYTAWKGPVADEGSNSFKVLKGQSAIYTDNSDVPTDAYSDPVCHVQGVYEIPATVKNRDLIKRYIMEHGAVTASINADDKYWTGKKAALYDYQDYSEENVADHEIMIVGWDDEYSASHFITAPPKDGAFICRNSWGTGYGAKGYFYMSYYDNVLCNNIVAAYDCAVEGDTNWYDNNYQYAASITHVTDPIIDKENVVYMYDDNNAGYGIIIEPDSDEMLSAIGYFSMTTGTCDTAQIYKLPKEDSDYYKFSETGDPVTTLECTAITGGYHTFSLTEPIDILKGERYLVLIKPHNNTKLVYEKAMDVTGEDKFDEWSHNLGAIHTVNTASGMSYLMSEDKSSVVRQTDKDFFVKAYTKEKTADGG